MLATQKQPASIVFNRRRTSTDLSRCSNAAPATQNDAEMLKSSYLPRKSSRPASIEFNRASADLSGGALRAALATQNDTEMLRVLHLPPKMRLRRSKCCTCTSPDLSGGAPSAAPATKNQLRCSKCGVHSTHSSPDFRGPLCRCSPCCTCHAK